MQGSFREDPEGITGDVPDGFGWAALGSLEETCLFRTTISWKEGTEAVGLMIHADAALEKWCQLRLEVRHGKILMDRYNRVDGDQSYQDERPVTFHKNKAEITLVVSGNIMLVYVDDVALTSRSTEACAVHRRSCWSRKRQRIPWVKIRKYVKKRFLERKRFKLV